MLRVVLLLPGHMSCFSSYLQTKKENVNLQDTNLNVFFVNVFPLFIFDANGENLALVDRYSFLVQKPKYLCFLVFGSKVKMDYTLIRTKVICRPPKLPKE